MTPEEEKFLKEHRFCIISTLRKSGTPSATPVYYIYEGGKLIISVTKTRAKTAHVLRDPRVCVCVLHEEKNPSLTWKLRAKPSSLKTILKLRRNGYLPSSPTLFLRQS